jgi:protein-S-isoprenylcysteine O-methyltransferase Ste14
MITLRFDRVNDLNKKALSGLLRLVIILAGLLFTAAWTIRYWQAWVFLSVFFASVLAITLYLTKNDPSLLARRIRAGPHAEKEPTQKVIQLLGAIAFVGVIVFPAVDHRLAWSAVSPYVSLAGDVLVALGLFLIFLVFKENTYTSAVIEVDVKQTVVATGPYRLVRHPMYAGALVMLLGVPLALGSLWGLVTIIPITFVIVWRLLDEEKFLAGNLPGYSEYRSRVKHRLVPFIW